MPMESNASSEKKHAYGGRQCMACGGKACNISYEALRDMVEKKQLGAGGVKEGMEQPLGYAKGGKVEFTEHELKSYLPTKMGSEEFKNNATQKGVHAPHSSRRASDSYRGQETADEKKGHHRRVLAELKSMKKPHGHFAEGGPVWVKDKYGNSTETHPEPSASPSPVTGENEKRARSQLANAFGHAKGGEIESMGDDVDMPMDGDDDMLMDHCVGECMSALKSGDKAAFKDAMHTMMADMMRKMGKE